MTVTKTAAKSKKRRIKDPIEDRILYAVTYTLVFLFVLLVLYPIIFVISASFSSATAVSTGKVILWPVDPSLDGYKAVFSHKRILTSFRNTVFYTVAGTFINVVMTLIAAYPLSRPRFQGKRFYMLLFVFTMFFSGGLIPTYILMTQIKFVNTIWAMLLPGALSVYNMIIVRTFILSNIPNELLESAKMDGCSDIRYLVSIVIPLSKAVIAVITLFYAVGHWNSYFSALIYLNNPKLYPLQLVLRDILVQNEIASNDFKSTAFMEAKQNLAALLKYSLIVVSSVPIIVVYPFAQKYFIKGVMVGSLKG
ncbi:carbohydrate ABC transporter permease [Pseudoclostridium thermosuccinogenes]|jgi:multiple sugar transport system permease protein/putative aldouronate transport system permease protein|uniref:carbohydrate ABC transporter permease n=1 Tax=Clostridium thermosuccinogenes TaxID=84032 RepID=UPI000CCC0D1F|nr:carbohydrate ABC transporter permease [Pseudoclostridium thermosuccinogenes]PNT93124.1 sugar ABC transporter permease [Pseudoclostridium thermosuccinogenes]